MFERNDTQDDPFASIDKADANGGRNPYLLEGQYLLKVDKLSTFRSRGRILFYLAELEIVQSDCSERPAGLICSWMTKLESDMGPINVKRLLAALNGIDPTAPEANTEITSDVARLSVAADQPFKGFEVYAQAVLIKKKGDGEDFLDIKWIPVAPSAV